MALVDYVPRETVVLRCPCGEERRLPFAGLALGIAADADWIAAGTCAACGSTEYLRRTWDRTPDAAIGTPHDEQRRRVNRLAVDLRDAGQSHPSQIETHRRERAAPPDLLPRAPRSGRVRSMTNDRPPRRSGSNPFLGEVEPPTGSPERLAIEFVRLQERVRVLEGKTDEAVGDADRAASEAIKLGGSLSANERECERRHREVIDRLGKLESHEDAERKLENEKLLAELTKLRESREETSQHWTRWAVATIVSFAIAVGLLFAGRALATSSGSSTSGGSSVTSGAGH